MRKYTKRVKSTKRKTYQDYLDFRKEQLNKGYVLQEEMSESSFNELYDRLISAKKTGEIKSQAWQELKKRERYDYFNTRIENLVKAAKDRGTPMTRKQILTSSKAEIDKLYEYIAENKESGLYGGDYE